MSPQDPAPARAEDASTAFVALVAELQQAIVQLSVAVRSHLAEMQRAPPEEKHARESHRMALGLTARNLAAATEGLNEAFGALRASSRTLAQLLSQTEVATKNP